MVHAGRVTGQRPTASTGALATVALVVGYAALASLTEPLTGAAALAVAVPCAVVLLLLRRPSRGEAVVAGQPVCRTAALWVALAVSAAAWELAAWLQQPAYDVATADHPTVSVLLDPVTDDGLSRFVVWGCWLYAGYRLVRR